MGFITFKTEAKGQLPDGSWFNFHEGDEFTYETEAPAGPTGARFVHVGTQYGTAVVSLFGGDYERSTCSEPECSLHEPALRVGSWRVPV